jgi:hypothetical protein
MPGTKTFPESDANGTSPALTDGRSDMDVSTPERMLARNTSARVIVQPRDRKFLAELATMRVVDLEHAMIVAGFGSLSRATRRLRKLTHAGLLRRFNLGSGGGRKALYSSSEKGARLAGVPVRGPRRPQGALLVADFFVEHQLAVNAIYCAVKFRSTPLHDVSFHRWISFHETISPTLRLIPDGYVEFMTPAGINAAFLEVDLGTENLNIWKEKTRQYLQLATSGVYRQTFGQDRFHVLVAANSERRQESIRKTIGVVTEKIFRFTTLENARTRFFSPIWLRPVGNQPESLFEQPQ